ncbi:MAG: flavin reductase [Cyclobacteriaceae bacterium]
MIKHFSIDDISSADKDFRRDLINSLTGYKSLHLMGTINKDGMSNLAPFSQVFHVGANPPLLGILFRPHTVERHTLENILESRFFTLNHVTPDFYKQAHQCSARWQQSEFEATGLEEIYLDAFIAPYVKISPLKIGCILADKIELSINDTILIIGGIQHVYLEETAVNPSGFVNMEKLGTVAVTGLDEYHTARRLARLSYAKPGQPVREIKE